ncbi:hypothetical protein [Corynebacterium sp. ACRQP]|uniref:hypothetical protein n=1 Tax=Corynebacterium sp. ACRQP TaxID=2918195 RepID=UPI001EF73484|nr:hypothetical protein [Corynebacterium sp. ACRQP]MCG7235791.1 hypothetical protein [Corynebacterium sp. ACRQP]
MELHAVRYDDRTFDEPSVDNINFSTVRFESCTITRPRGKPGKVDHIAFVDTDLSSPEFGFRADWLSTVTGSTLRDVVIEGRGAQFPIRARVLDSTITGELRNVGFGEHYRYDQLDGVDLSGCKLENVSFQGIPMERVKLSPEDEALVVEDWASVASDVYSVVREAMDSPDQKVEYAAIEIFDALSQDASLSRSSNGGFSSDDSLDYDESRGARYVHELAFTDKPEWFMDVIHALYRKVGDGRLVPFLYR